MLVAMRVLHAPVDKRGCINPDDVPDDLAIAGEFRRISRRLRCMRCDVIDSTVGIYTGGFRRGEGSSRTGDFGLLSLGRNLELEHCHTVTIDGYCTVCRRRRRNNRHDAPRKMRV
jgi:hypothetical protein